MTLTRTPLVRGRYAADGQLVACDEAELIERHVLTGRVVAVSVPGRADREAVIARAGRRFLDKDGETWLAYGYLAPAPTPTTDSEDNDQ